MSEKVSAQGNSTAEISRRESVSSLACRAISFRAKVGAPICTPETKVICPRSYTARRNGNRPPIYDRVHMKRHMSSYGYQAIAGGGVVLFDLHLELDGAGPVLETIDTRASQPWTSSVNPRTPHAEPSTPNPTGSDFRVPAAGFSRFGVQGFGLRFQGLRPKYRPLPPSCTCAQKEVGRPRGNFRTPYGDVFGDVFRDVLVRRCAARRCVRKFRARIFAKIWSSLGSAPKFLPAQGPRHRAKFLAKFFCDVFFANRPRHL